MNIYANVYKGEKRSKGSFGSYGTPVCNLTERKNDGVTLVYADVLSESALDPDFGVGIDIPINGRILAIKKNCEFWLRPAFPSSPSDIPDNTQLLITENESGKFTVILPVVGDTYKTVLIGKDESTVTAKIYSGYAKLSTCKTLVFATSSGNNIHSLLEKCTKAALFALGSNIPAISERSYPEIFEYLGWCSWDAMQIRINREGLIEKCLEFRKKNIPVSWMILDDMWAEIRDFYGREYYSFGDMCKMMHASALYDLEADPLRFPGGLKETLAEIKKLGFKPGIWYPTTGYWRGIEKNSPAYEKLKDHLIETDDGIFVPSFEKEKAEGYFNTINTFLKDSGAEFIKVDNQSMFNRFYSKLTPIGNAAHSYHDALESSAETYFDSNMINCMGMSSEDMWSRKTSAISRTSGDFLPENSEWFKKHIMQCSYNSLLQGQFYYCDWDMWWTDDSQALRNSLARAISGGPIYVSDKIERSIPEVLSPLTLSDGRVLRCDRPAMPTSDCITSDPTKSGKPIKLQNVANGCGIILLFNLSDDNTPVNGTLSPSDVSGLSGNEFAVYSHFDRSVKIMKANERLKLTLDDNNSYALYIIAPYENGFAAIGNPDKFISPATIASINGESITQKEAGALAYVKNGKLFIEP